MERRLGNQGVVDLDGRTGTPRVLARLDGTLTGASARPARDVASAYVRANLAVLGLTASDVDAEPAVEALPGGVTSVSWRQSVDGIPSSDHSLRVNVGADGSVLSLLGAPEHAPDVPETEPALDAGEAVRAVQDDVGSHRSLVRRRGPSGARRATDYGDDTEASLVTVADRLAWRVQYRAGADAVYDATVDARTGKVLRRVNMVKSESRAQVWERFPGSGAGGTAATVDLEQSGWLSATAANLNGPNAHAYSDLDDNNGAATSEEVPRTAGGFSFPLQPVAGTGCDAAHVCSWSGTGDRTLNRQQDAVQAFYFANRFHDHLAAAPIGFTAAKGAFEGADDLLLETMDGASTGPDANHLNNANMFTPPDGAHPRMQMYLWSTQFRRISSGSDAAILYHEYTHGLSNRLVKDADGYGALNSPQAGAMGEAWSDWYAQDFIVDQYPALDTGAAGEVVMGAYTDLPGSKLRFSPLDCPVTGADPIACPGRPALGSGGFSYGDFGRIAGGAEVHADGEIWAQTLWDLRSKLGSAKARALVTTGMSLLPPEPSFLDGRNGILLADQTLFGGEDTDVLWGVFAGRGMGFFAASTSSDDTGPAESFVLPPAAGAPRGTVTGRVTNAIGGAGVAGITVGLTGGLSSVQAVTDAGGRYTIADVPAGTYLKVFAGGGGFDDSAVTSLAVGGGSTITFSPVVKRNWAASKGGATIASSTGSEYVEYGCGPGAAVDQSQKIGWSTAAGTTGKNLVVKLPAAVDITQLGIDPSATCGDSDENATGGYRVETSPDGAAWTTARTGTFTSDNLHTLNLLAPTAGATGVRYVRLTLLSSQSSGASFRDLSELSIYGAPVASAPGVAVEPDTKIDSGPSPFVFSSDDPAATFECKVDAGEYAACTSPDTRSFSDGPHTFSVRAKDPAGAVDQTPATKTFTVDTTAPETNIDSGPSPFVFWSNDSTATFECKVDDGAFAPCLSPDARVFADGTHTFTVRATDPAGNVDATPASKRFTVDTTAPETKIDSGPSPFLFSSDDPTASFECKVDGGEFAGCTSPDPRVFADGSHTFSVRAKDPAGNVDQTPATTTFTVDTVDPETKIDSGPSPFLFSSDDPTASFECKVDGGEFAGCTSPDPRVFTDGSHTFTVRAKDPAGNVDQTPATKTFTVDTMAPETKIDSGVSGTTRDTSPLFSFSSSEAGATFECRLTGEEFAPCGSPREVGPLDDGAYTFEVRATDAAGHTDTTPAARSFTVDTTAPVTALETGGPPFRFSSSEPGSSFECKVDAGVYETCTSPHAIQDDLDDGPHVFLVKATDASGNTDQTPETATFTVDTVAPDTAIDAGPSPFQFSSTEAGSSFRCRVDTGDFAPCTSPHTVDTAALSEGEHRFDVLATDAAGNADTTPASQTFTVDRTAPAVTSLTGPSSRSNDRTPTFEFASTDESATFQCNFSAVDAPGVFKDCDSPKEYGPLDTDDRYTLTVRAKDAAGNVGAEATYSYSLFTTAPQTGISSPPDDGTNVSNDRNPVLVLASSPPGATFTCTLDGVAITPCTTPLTLHDVPDGTHIFEATATDDAGNVDPTPVTRKFKVDATPPETFLDSEPPSPVHSGPVPFGVRGSEDAVFCALDDSDYRSCGEIIQADALAAGEHIFRARAEDAAGNVDPTPIAYPFTVVNAAPAVTLDLDAASGVAPHTVRPSIAGTDPDQDRLTYRLDFGDGQSATGALPVTLVGHRYDLPGVYTVKVTVSDGRATATAERDVTVTVPLGDTSPPVETPLSLSLSAPTVSLGTFIPGLARDYTASLTATTTGTGTLSASDGSATARGHLVGAAGALAEPLQVKAASGAFTPLTGSVTVPTTIELKQSIGADEVLRPGAYSKALTFTLAVTTP